MGMPLNEFTDEAVSGPDLKKVKQPYDEIESQRQVAFREVIGRMNKMEANQIRAMLVLVPIAAPARPPARAESMV